MLLYRGVNLSMARQYLPVEVHVPPPGAVLVLPAEYTVNGAYVIRRSDGTYVDTTGTTTSGIQEALNDVLQYGGSKVILGKGTYTVSTTITEGANHTQGQPISIEGAGMGETIIKDAVAAGSGGILDFTITGNTHLRFSDLTFRGADSVKNADYMLDFDLAASKALWTSVEVDGNTQRYRSLIRGTNCYDMSFVECYFQDNNGPIFVMTTSGENSGNLRFFGGQVSGVFKTFIFMDGGNTNNNLGLFGTKLVGSIVNGGTDYKQLTATSNWTAASKTITVGTGLNLSQNMPFLICFTGSGLTELHTVDSYDSGAGTVTLFNGLTNDYWGGGGGAEKTVEVFAGGIIGIATGFLAPVITCDNCHFEAMTTAVLMDAPVVGMRDCLMGIGARSNALAQSEEYSVHISGASQAHEYSNIYYSDVRTDGKLINIVDDAGGAGVPGFVRTGFIYKIGTGMSIDDVINATGNSQYFTYKTAAAAEGWTIRGDVNLYRNAADEWKTDDALVLGKYLTIGTFTDGTRGSPGNAGRVIYNSGDGNLNIDNGTNWITPDGSTT